LKLLAPVLTAALAVKTVAVVARMQNQAQQQASLWVALLMQTSRRLVLMDQLLIAGSITVQTPHQQQHLKVFWRLALF
jgi:hypothetical protein